MAFTRDSLRTLSIRCGLIGISMLGGVINARWLGPEGVGVFALFTLISAFAFRFGNLGFGSGFAFFLAQKKSSSRSLLELVGILSLVIPFVISIFLLAIWKVPYSPWNDFSHKIFYLSLFTIPIVYFKAFLGRFLSGHLKIKTINCSEVVDSCSHVILLTCLVIFLNLGVLGTIWSFLLSQLISTAYLFFYAYNLVEEEIICDVECKRKELCSQLWQYGRWNYVIMLANFVFQQLPLLVLKTLFTNNLVGIFSLSAGLMSRVWIVPNSFSEVLFPYVAASGELRTIRTNSLCRHFLAIMAILGIILALSIKTIILFLYGEAFSSSAYVFYALLPTLVTLPIFKFLTVHLSATGQPRTAALTMLLGLAPSLLSSFYFIHAYGAIGAALSISTTYSFLALISIYVYAKTTGSKISDIVVFNKDDWFYDVNLVTKKLQELFSPLTEKKCSS